MQKLGYIAEELFSSPISSFIYPEDREITGLVGSKLLSGEALLNFQNRYVKKDGSIVCLEWTSVYIGDREIVFARNHFRIRCIMQKQRMWLSVLKMRMIEFVSPLQLMAGV